MSDESGAGGAVPDLVLLISGCAAIFLGVFYFDQITAVLKAEVNSLTKMVAISKPPATRNTGARARPAPAGAIHERSVFLKADRYNQFYANAYINGRHINVLVDTGASHVSLTYEDASELGIHVRDRDFTGRARTANGVTRVAPVRIDRIRIGDVQVRNVDGFVGEEGRSFSTLLGMTFLRKLSRMNIRGRRLELVQ